MFQIPQHQYRTSATGESSLKKNPYNGDAINNQTQSSPFVGHTTNQSAFVLPPQAFISRATQEPQPQPSRVAQFLNQVINQPLQTVQIAAQNFTQQLEQMLNQMMQRPQGFVERTLAQAFNFFFGNAREGGKDDLVDREKRERNEDVMVDMFGDTKLNSHRKVAHKANAGLSSGGQ